MIFNKCFRIIRLLLIVGGFSNIFAQHPNVKIGGFIESHDPNEPSIFISPTNTDNMVVGTNLNHYYYSKNGGYTWSYGVLASTFGVHGDPCIIADKYGHFYFFHLSNPPGNAFADRIVCQKTSSPGGDWSNGSYTGLNGVKLQDKEWAGVDYNVNYIYVSWTQFDYYGSSDPNHYSNIMFSRSTDGGETWSSASRINEISGDCLDNDNTVEGAVPVAGPTSQVYVSWAGPEGLVFDKSINRGGTWLENDIFVSDIPGGWVYNIPGIYICNGMPVTSCDVSGGPYHGTIYINWSDQRSGIDDTDIWLVKSTDGGETWSEPKRVNDDPPGKHQFFTWMAVDRITGYIYIVFYDRRNYDNNQTDVYLAASIDGGETFLNRRISESSFIPEQDIFFGDYTNISAHDNVVRPVWIRMDNRQNSVWTALIDTDLLLDIATNPAVIPDKFEILSVYPNPFNSSTLIKYNLPENGRVKLKVYNILGEEVDVLIKNNQIAGTNLIRWNAHNLASGIYVFRLKSGNFVDIKKGVFIK